MLNPRERERRRQKKERRRGQRRPTRGTSARTDARWARTADILGWANVITPSEWLVTGLFHAEYRHMFTGEFRDESVIFKILMHSFDVPAYVELTERARASASPHLLLPCDIATAVPLEMFGVMRDHIGLVLPWLHGPTLNRHPRFGRFSGEDLARLLRQTAAGLAALDACGSNHGDVKPENLLDDADRGWTLLDWNPALTGTYQAAGGLVPGRMVHSLGYRSPRFKTGGGDPEMVKTIADDVFALGVTAFEAATGRHPFSGLKRLPRLEAHHTRWSQAQACITLAGAGVNVRRRLSLAKTRPDLPATLAALVDGCLAVEECDRPSLAVLLDGAERWETDRELTGCR